MPKPVNIERRQCTLDPSAQLEQAVTADYIASDCEASDCQATSEVSGRGSSVLSFVPPDSLLSRFQAVDTAAETFPHQKLHLVPRFLVSDPSRLLDYPKEFWTVAAKYNVTVEGVRELLTSGNLNSTESAAWNFVAGTYVCPRVWVHSFLDFLSVFLRYWAVCSHPFSPVTHTCSFQVLVAQCIRRAPKLGAPNPAEQEKETISAVPQGASQSCPLEGGGERELRSRR